MVRYHNEKHIEMCFEFVPIWQQHLSSFISLYSLQIFYVISLNSLWMLLTEKKKIEKNSFQNFKNCLVYVSLSLQPIQLSVTHFFH